jgi:transcriptional regulator with XRE-family HTH domain
VHKDFDLVGNVYRLITGGFHDGPSTYLIGCVIILCFGHGLLLMLVDDRTGLDARTPVGKVGEVAYPAVSAFPVPRYVRLCVVNTDSADYRSPCQCVLFARMVMKNFETQLVTAIKKKREAEGLSIRSLSSMIGVSFSTLARIERGEGLPDNNSKIRLLEWLGEAADDAGLKFDNVAFVHFRAAKNIRSFTVHTLLRAAECIWRDREVNSDRTVKERVSSKSTSPDDEGVALSKEELEKTAEKFRKELGLSNEEPLESLKLRVEGVQVHKLTEAQCLEEPLVKKLRTESSDEWSAMSVPLDDAGEYWTVLLNDCHTKERQRVTILEEYWHILLGHKLTKIARIAESYGRTYDKVEEHDAYYLASATLLPKTALIKAVRAKLSSTNIAQKFGTSPELVDYRIKRLGLWRDHVGKKVALASD